MTGRGLSDEEVARVLARAAELERARHPALPQLDDDTVEQIAVEAGLDRVAVRQALAELRAGSLEPAGRQGRGAGLLGPGSVRVQRLVPGPTGAVERRIRSFLHHQQFTVARHYGERTRWLPREGLVSDLRRKLDFTGRMRLKRVQWVEVTVVEEPGTGGGEVLVVIEAEAAGARAAHGALIGVGSVTGAAAAAAVAVTVDPLLATTAPAGLAAGAGLGHVAGRSVHRQRAASVATVLAGLLDRLEHPDAFHR